MSRAVTAENVGKLYRIGQTVGGYKTLRDVIATSARGRLRSGKSRAQLKTESSLWALRDVSLEIEAGESVGIIGRNGAGKSTFLKIVSFITEPTTGFVRVDGRVGSLLEVGTGFHPELTGRENIYLNGSILGMRRREIERKFDEIVEFAEVERFLNTPVKRYSSGMYIRLAFAVAANLDPEILIVDEVLAVGDRQFQQKCLGRMGAVADSGRTVLFVSHNLAAVSALCSRAYLLEDGRITDSGLPDDVIKTYVSKGGHSTSELLHDRPDRRGDGSLRFTRASLVGRGESGGADAVSGQSLIVSLEYEMPGTPRPLRNVEFSLAFYTRVGQLLFFCSTDMTGAELGNLPPKGAIRCVIPSLPRSEGRYPINIDCKRGGVQADWVPEALVIDVAAADFFGSGRLPPSGHAGFLVPHAWETE